MSPRMPAAFFGHGSPRITFQHNEITEVWSEFARTIPTPRAIVVISAHWCINASAVLAMARPRTIHDFFYAPEELYAFEYGAPGDPELVEELIELVRPTWLGPDIDSWGFDHGAWALLAHLFPNADVPTVELSINAAMALQYHVDLGAQLAPLRDRGVLVIGSGNIIHNPVVGSPEGRQQGLYDRSVAFDREVGALLSSAPSELAKLAEHEDYRLAAPTDDHFVPLCYFAGLAAAADEQPLQLLDGAAIGAVGMSAYALTGSD